MARTSSTRARPGDALNSRFFRVCACSWQATRCSTSTGSATPARISPEAPVPVVRTRSAEQRPGGAANVALNLAALGARRCARRRDRRRRARRTAATAARAARRPLRARGSRRRADDSQAARACPQPTADSRSMRSSRSSHAPARSASAFGEARGGADVVVLSDYAKGTLANAAELVAACRAAGVPRARSTRRARTSRSIAARRAHSESRRVRGGGRRVRRRGGILAQRRDAARERWT